jgi:hypothetical protein
MVLPREEGLAILNFLVIRRLRGPIYDSWSLRMTYRKLISQ